MSSIRLVIPVILVALFIGCSSKASAQFRWGPHAGVNLANLDIESDAVVAANNIIGIVVGVHGEYQLTRALSVYLSPQIVTKGSDVEVVRMVGEAVQTTYRENYTYVEAPIGLRLRLPVRGVKPYLFSGIGAAPLLSSTFSIQESSDGSTPEEEYEEDGTDYRTSMDLVFHAGVGVEMPLSQTTAITFDIRYSRSLQTIDKPQISSFEPTPIYTSDIMLVVGVLFH